MLLPKNSSKRRTIGGTRVAYTSKLVPSPPPQPLSVQSINSFNSKINRIENLLKQLRFEKEIDLKINKTVNEVLVGKIIALEVSIAILKDEI